METPDHVAGADGDQLVLDGGVVWPGKALAPLIRQNAILMSAWGSLRPAPQELHPADGPAAAHYLEAWRAIFGGASNVFAQVNRWRASPTPFSPEQLRTGRTQREPRDRPSPTWPEVLGASPDAITYFRGPGGRPTALVVHSLEAVQLAIAGLRLARLPASWWSPGATQAYVVTRTRP